MEPKRIQFGCLTSKQHAEVREMDLPELGPDQILLKQLACNICTADYTHWMGLREHQGYPASGGHECAGVVVETGSQVKNLKAGDFVALANNYCGKCHFCRTGRESECQIRASYDQHADGYKGRMGFATFFVRPETSVIKMNPDLSPQEAAFLEPAATVVKGIEKLRVRPFDKVVVVGAGTMGLLNAQVARAYGCEVLVTELMEKKLRTARELGFTTLNPAECDVAEEVRARTGGGADAVIVAVGATSANRQAVDMLKKMDGKLLVFAAAYPPPELGVTANDIHYRRLEIIGTYLGDLRDFLQAARLLNERRIDVRPLLEPNSYPLERLQEAFAEASEPGKYRVSVLMHPDDAKMEKGGIIP